MRLSTLARKIDKTPNQLISYLEKKEIEITNGLHTKLDSDTVDFILQQFLPEQQFVAPVPETIIEDESYIVEKASDDAKTTPLKDESLTKAKKKSNEAEIPTEPKVLEISDKEEKIIELATPEIPELIPEIKTGTLDDLENENSDEIELIKAKKVKLDGIKVVGKIDLQKKQQKKIDVTDKDDTTSIETEKSEKSASPIKTLKSTNKKKQVHSNKRKSIAYEEKLRKEDRYKRNRIKQKALTEKKRKIEFYKNNIHPKTTPKAKKRKQTSNVVDAKKVGVAKNPIIRLWEWLNGKYDRY